MQFELPYTAVVAIPHLHAGSENVTMYSFHLKIDAMFNTELILISPDFRQAWKNNERNLADCSLDKGSHHFRDITSHLLLAAQGSPQHLWEIQRTPPSLASSSRSAHARRSSSLYQSSKQHYAAVFLDYTTPEGIPLRLCRFEFGKSDHVTSVDQALECSSHVLRAVAEWTAASCREYASFEAATTKVAECSKSVDTLLMEAQRNGFTVTHGAPLTDHNRVLIETIMEPLDEIKDTLRCFSGLSSVEEGNRGSGGRGAMKQTPLLSHVDCEDHPESLMSCNRRVQLITSEGVRSPESGVLALASSSASCDTRNRRESSIAKFLAPAPGNSTALLPDTTASSQTSEHEILTSVNSDTEQSPGVNASRADISDACSPSFTTTALRPPNVSRDCLFDLLED